MNGSAEPKPDYADEHESGQFRLAVPGEQVSFLPLPDSLIPCLRDTETLDNPEPSAVPLSHVPAQAETLPL